MLDLKDVDSTCSFRVLMYRRSGRFVKGQFGSRQLRVLTTPLKFCHVRPLAHGLPRPARSLQATGVAGISRSTVPFLSGSLPCPAAGRCTQNSSPITAVGSQFRILDRSCSRELNDSESKGHSSLSSPGGGVRVLRSTPGPPSLQSSTLAKKGDGEARKASPPRLPRVKALV
jgi:hypothetical protein